MKINRLDVFVVPSESMHEQHESLVAIGYTWDAANDGIRLYTRTRWLRPTDVVIVIREHAYDADRVALLVASYTSTIMDEKRGERCYKTIEDTLFNMLGAYDRLRKQMK